MTEWKPEKNVSSPWDVDVWENNIGQPVKPSGDNLPYPYTTPVGTEHLYSKWYDVDTTKITSIKDVDALFSDIGLKITETNENFDEVKHLLIIPEQPKTLDEIKEEFDEKIDELIETTKEKFEYSKVVAEKRYKYEFDKIIEKFEYAKDNGYFPYINLAYTTGLSAGSYLISNGGGVEWEPSFVIKQGNNHKGYYTSGNGLYFKYYMPTKPNMIARFFMKTCLALRWVDEKDT